MKSGYTKIVFLVDRSGSMRSCVNDMIGGYNTFIQTQKENVVGECSVSFYQFDTEFESVYVNTPIADVKELTGETFVPRGSTALLDSVCRLIDELGVELSALQEDDRPEKVLVVILTDGEENASSKFSAEDVKQRITTQTEVYKWEFLYIGANQNSWNVGQSIGVAGASTINYVSRGKNTPVSSATLWKTLANKTVSYRATVGGTMKFTSDEQSEQNRLVTNNVP
jgi:hypothetical protein